jgi:hypothetical protein
MLEGARNAERLIENLASSGHERTADALAWRRRTILRELSGWIRQINNAATVMLACREVGHEIIEQVLQQQGRRDASLGIASDG